MIDALQRLASTLPSGESEAVEWAIKRIHALIESNEVLLRAYQLRPVEVKASSPAIALMSQYDYLQRTMAMENQVTQLRQELEAARGGIVDEVISLITTEQLAMRRLYPKHEYGINKVCNRLKIFISALLKPPPTDNEEERKDGNQ